MKLIILLIFLNQACSLSAQTSAGPVDIQGIVDNMKKLETAVTDLQSQAKSDSQMYAAEIAVLRTQFTQAENDLRASEAEVTKLKQDLQAALADLNVVKAQNTVLGATKNTTSNDLMQVKNDLKNLNLSVAAISPTVMSNQAALSSLASHMNSTKQDLDNLKSGVHSSTLNSTSIWNEINSLKADSASTQTNLLKMSGSVQALQLNEDTYQKSLSRLQYKQSDDEVKAAALAHDIGVLKSNMSHLLHLSAVDTYNLEELQAHIELLEQDVAFEATVSTGSGTTTIPSGAALRFNTIAYNAGHGYDPSTGVFTVPVSGTYLFWVNVVYYNNNRQVDVEISSSRSVIGVGYGDASHEERYGTVNTNTVAYLKKGETVWFTPSDGMRLKEWFSSVGGSLLRAH